MAQTRVDVRREIDYVEWLEDDGIDHFGVQILDHTPVGSRDDDDRMRLPIGIPVEPVDDVPAADARHHEIEDQRLVVVFPEPCDRFFTIGTALDTNLLASEGGRDERSNRRIVIDDECHHSPALSSIFNHRTHPLLRISVTQNGGIA